MHTLHLYCDLLSGKHEVFFLMSVDQSDSSMNTPTIRQRVEKLFASIPNGEGVFSVGNSGTKVQAINADMNLAPPDWDVLLLASDDMIPIVPNYDAIIDEHMQENFPDYNGCLWFNDGYTKKICTLVVMGQPYFRRFGYIYHPDYLSLWCDNEWTEVAQANGKLRFVDQTIIRHDHFANTRTVRMDDVYRKNESFSRQDGVLYNVRKAQGFFMGQEPKPCDEQTSATQGC